MGRHRQDAERHAPPPTRLAHRLTSLPWVSLVLAALVLAGSVALLRPDVFSATSTFTAASSRAAQEAAVTLTGADLMRQVREEVELADDWSGSLVLEVDRPHPEVVAVRARSTDPRLAALAADTAAALVVAGGDDLAPGRAAVVPTRPVDDGGWWAWAVGGAAALAVAVLVEQLHLRRVQREMRAPRALPAPRAAS